MGNLTNEEVTNQIYDTLAGNVGFSENHIAFNPANVLQAECNGKDGVIILQLSSGRNIQIVISDAPNNYFSQE